MDQENRLPDSAPLLCPKCLDIPADERKLADTLDRYLTTLDEDVRVSPEQYAARLSLCADCPHRAIYTCRKCGCYVQVRAARKSYACPSEEEKWGKIEEVDS